MADASRGQAPQEGERKGITLPQKLMLMALLFCECKKRVPSQGSQLASAVCNDMLALQQ